MQLSTKISTITIRMLRHPFLITFEIVSYATNLGINFKSFINKSEAIKPKDF